MHVDGACGVQVGLLDRLTRIAPEGLSSFFFASSGSEVVDNAVKLARAATKRPNIICFEVGLDEKPESLGEKFETFLSRNFGTHRREMNPPS